MLRAEAARSDSKELVELRTLIQSKEAGIVESGSSVLETTRFPDFALVTLGPVTALDPTSSFEIFSAPKSQSSFKPDLLSSACKFDIVWMLPTLCSNRHTT